jgi:hypothetical protein
MTSSLGINRTFFRQNRSCGRWNIEVFRNPIVTVIVIVTVFLRLVSLAD